MPPQRQVFLGIGLLASWVVVGTLGYLTVEEGWSLLDAFYMTIITVTTVGYREGPPLPPPAQRFSTSGEGGGWRARSLSSRTITCCAASARSAGLSPKGSSGKVCRSASSTR